MRYKQQTVLYENMLILCSMSIDASRYYRRLDEAGIIDIIAQHPRAALLVTLMRIAHEGDMSQIMRFVHTNRDKISKYISDIKYDNKRRMPIPDIACHIMEDIKNIPQQHLVNVDIFIRGSLCVLLNIFHNTEERIDMEE